jgi:hypothetical protein
VLILSDFFLFLLFSDGASLEITGGPARTSGSHKPSDTSAGKQII